MKAGFLGRFQPLHLGHYKVIKELRDEFDEFSIVIGSAEKSRTEDNPLTFKERKKLIKACFQDIEVMRLEDTEKTPEGNKEWVEKLEELGLNVVISGNELVEELVKQHTSLEHVRPEMHDDDIYSGTEVRRRVKSGEEWRYLLPKCSHSIFEDLLEAVKKSGTQYEFKPGWSRKNAFHGTE